MHVLCSPSNAELSNAVLAAAHEFAVRYLSGRVWPRKYLLLESLKLITLRAAASSVFIAERPRLEMNVCIVCAWNVSGRRPSARTWSSLSSGTQRSSSRATCWALRPSRPSWHASTARACWTREFRTFMDSTLKPKQLMLCRLCWTLLIDLLSAILFNLQMFS